MKKFVRITAFATLSLSLILTTGLTANADSTYVVKRGDSLWKIAANTLGNGNRYTEIVSKNNLKNLSIKPGMTLIIPDGSSNAAPQATVNTQPASAPNVSQVPSSAPQPGTGVSASVSEISLNPAWTYANFSKINSGKAVFYKAENNRKNLVVAVNAGHGTKGGASVKTYCHPDKSPKVTGGSTAAGNTMATAVSGGMTFKDGTLEPKVTLAMARVLKDKLLASGYDVLMLRNDDDVQLDNIARTVIANNNADCHISLHWDGDGLSYDKGCFYISTPTGIKNMEPVKSNWEKHEALGKSLINGLKDKGLKLYRNGNMDIDLTQTSYSTIPSVDMELGNQSSAHDDATLSKLADGLVSGVNTFFGR